MTTPLERVINGQPLPADLKHLDEARDEAKNDLSRLLTWFATERTTRGEAIAVTRLAQGLMDQPRIWTQMDLCTALAEAVVLIDSHRKSAS
jgi:hypothetical protein